MRFNGNDVVLWGVVVMMTFSLVGGWFARRALVKGQPREGRRPEVGGVVKQTKISAILTDDDVETLMKLAAKRGTTVTDVLRTAIGTEAYLDERRDEGQKVLLEDLRGDIKELVFRR